MATFLLSLGIVGSLQYVSYTAGVWLLRLNEEKQIRLKIHEELMSELPSDGGSTLAGVKRELACDYGYDVCGIVEEYRQTDPATITTQWWDDRHVPVQRRGDYIKAAWVPPRPQVRLVPKLVAACVLELRCKYGVLSTDSANVMLIEKEYLKLCKRHRVRQFDIAKHRQFVLNVFFSDTGEYDVSLARARVPNWLKWMRSDLSVTRAPSVI